MKRWEFFSVWKVLAVLLNQVCAVVLVLSVTVCTLYLGSGGLDFFGQGERFEDTLYYENEVEEQIYRCIRAASRESKFERNGVYDPNLPVDIQEYAKNNRILKTEQVKEGLCYRLEDLLNWSLEGYMTGTVMKIIYQDGTVGYLSKANPEYVEKTSVYEEGKEVASATAVYGATETYEEFPPMDAQSLKASMGELFSEGFKNREDREEVDGVYEALEPYGIVQPIADVVSIHSVVEKYIPMGCSSVVAYAEEHQLSANELGNLYQDLEMVLSSIYNDYISYTENLELFSPGMTNMRYIVLPKEITDITEDNYEQLVFTNIKKFGGRNISSQEDVLAYFRAQPDYLIFDSSDMSFEAVNMPLSLSDVNSYLKGYQPSVEGDYILAITIDSSYSASDNLQEYKQQYNAVRPWGRLAVYGVILGSIVYLLTLVYLTLAAGRGVRSEDSAIKLNGFDRICTELAAVLLAIPVVGIFWVMQEWWPAFGRGSLQMAIWTSGVAFVLNLLFLAGYLSFIRRMRSRTLWSNSILHGIWELMSHAFRNRKATTKVLLTYLLFLVVNLGLLCGGRPGFAAALVFDLIVGAVLIQRALQRQRILDGIEQIVGGNLTYQISKDKLRGDNLRMAEAVNKINKGLSTAVAKSVRDERLKSDLITNVSHDIKTPLTSIINYVDLLKREDIQNDRVKDYIRILESKADRLKHLTEDLVEASKISSGNIKLDLERIQFQELIHQTNGEFCEKFEQKGLQLIVNMPQEPVVVEADGRRLWRIIENLYHNVAKYAMPNTRVYVELTPTEHTVCFSIKNISEQSLNIDAGELTERFIRGDVARSTEGSGLGLSIAKNLTELQKGTFDIYLDGDLFKVTVAFPRVLEVLPEVAEAEIPTAEVDK